MASGLFKWAKQHIEPGLDPELLQRLESVPKKNLNAFGVDQFGFDPEVLKITFPIAAWIYKNYFRCDVFGIDKAPEGRKLVISNHSGQLPFDGMMIFTAFILDALHPCFLRGMVERWVSELPFVSSFYARIGQIVGEPSICQKLLEANESVLVFPEGVKGISKLFQDRYQLAQFGHGFMRLALQTKTPIVPVAVIGAEEQAPAIANIVPLAKLMNTPAWPLIFPQLVPIPMPVKYRIYFGDPMLFKGDGSEDDSIVGGYVEQVRHRIQTMLNKGRRKRKSIFY